MVINNNGRKLYGVVKYLIINIIDKIINKLLYNLC
jgi:hypothetical protein